MPKKKTLVAAVVAFASTPQGRRAIQQGRAWLQRPENRAKVQRAITNTRPKTDRGPAAR